MANFLPGFFPEQKIHAGHILPLTESVTGLSGIKIQEEENMPTFQNRATLSVGDTVINSNVVQGEITEVLRITKTAIGGQYVPGDTVTYAVSVVNTGTAAYTGLTLTDNLGEYTFGTGNRTPLTYVEDSVLVYVNGVLQAAPTVNEPFSVTGLTVPAGGNLLVLYSAEVNQFAPPAAGSTILNTVTLTGAGLSAPLTAEETIIAEDSPSLTITKAICPSVITENGTVTYTFVIQNTGNTPVVTTDNAVITDTFETTAAGLEVTFNGEVWTEGADYTYDNATGLFTTTGPITVPAATYTQDPETGEWTLQPGVSELVITAMGVQIRA